MTSFWMVSTKNLMKLIRLRHLWHYGTSVQLFSWHQRNAFAHWVAQSKLSARQRNAVNTKCMWIIYYSLSEIHSCQDKRPVRGLRRLTQASSGVAQSQHVKHCAAYSDTEIWAFTGILLNQWRSVLYAEHSLRKQLKRLHCLLPCLIATWCGREDV